MPRRIVTGAVFVSCLLACGYSSAARGFLPMSWNELVTLATDMSQPHEGIPAGVPVEYDWARQARMGAGNDPGGFTAFTGWGQVFPAEGTSIATLSILLRDMRVLVCHGQRRTWTLLQQGGVEGAQFQPDFGNNHNQPPVRVAKVGEAIVVKIADRSVYHFWPRQGRVNLPSQNLCGIVVLVQAKLVPDMQNQSADALEHRALLGLGADYWKSKSAQWDNYESNRDVAIGRLKWVGDSWRWYGLAIATPAELQRLSQFGYAPAPMSTR